MKWHTLDSMINFQQTNEFMQIFADSHRFSMQAIILFVNYLMTETKQRSNEWAQFDKIQEEMYAYF